jgi:ABC-type transport system involved in multi-copper enzyme maturation permease subunit
MNSTTLSTEPTPAAPLLPGSPGASRAGGWRAGAANVQAIAELVMLELYRRKDFYVLFILTALITLGLGSVNFFNEDKIVRYVKELCLFLIWAASLVIAITTAARQFPAEQENRTIFPLLAKPVTRSQLVLGKFWGCWLAGGLALGVFYLFFILLSGLREHQWPVADYVQAISLHWCLLGVVTAMTLLGSMLFSSAAANNTILFVGTAGILLLGRKLNAVAQGLSEPLHSLVYAIYFCLPHLEFFDVRDLIVHNWGAIPWLYWLGAAGYALAYMGIFLAATCLVFRRKPLN